MSYEIIRLIGHPEIKERAAQRFHRKRDVWLEVYVKNMEECLDERQSVPQ